MVDHIDDSKQHFKSRLIPFIKFYDKLANRELPQFMNKDSLVQIDIYNDLLTQNSELEELLRAIQHEELNGDNSASAE